MGMDKTVRIEEIRGCEGNCITINDTRIAGPKPWGGGHVIKKWDARVDHILKALGVDADADRIHPNPENMQYIIDSIPAKELLAQLAEEASELCHAALKLRRVYDDINPTPVPKEDALKNLLEEIADVWLLIQILGLDEDAHMEQYREIMAQKVDRWAHRLDGENAHG